MRESVFRNLGNFCLWNPEYRSRNPESLLMVGIRNPGSANEESGIQSLESWIQDCLRFPYKGRCYNYYLKVTKFVLWLWKAAWVGCTALFSALLLLSLRWPKTKKSDEQVELIFSTMSTQYWNRKTFNPKSKKHTRGWFIRLLLLFLYNKSLAGRQTVTSLSID